MNAQIINEKDIPVFKELLNIARNMVEHSEEFKDSEKLFKYLETRYPNFFKLEK